MTRNYSAQISQRIYGKDVSFYSPLLIQSKRDLLNENDSDAMIIEAMQKDEDMQWLFQEDPQIIIEISCLNEIKDNHLEGYKVSEPYKVQVN